ncbi:uncharacterized protein LOC143555210 [Bidens hawaiensis]|uniref:uncharacterized protein LOC143555210 n=1 Tax=Bidens hawaiensis TaxID=980011 RepID=UPI00404AE9F7
MLLIESQNLIKPHNLKYLTRDEYELTINQSIQSLLDSLQNPNLDLSSFTTKFVELMQEKPNSHLETIWVLSGLTFKISNHEKDGILDQLSAVKDLFQSVTTLSASSSPVVSIALTAPVIYKLYSVIIDLKSKEVGLMSKKKARREIKSFVDVILGYFSICCEGLNSDDDTGLISPLNDLISIWVRGESTENGSKQFFPLLSDEITHWVNEKSGGNIGVLAGAVIVEALLLKLCLKFSDGSLKQELQNELRTWAVCSITGFHNFYLFDILVKMLLEPNLPVMSLLSSEDESLLRKVLYDAVILPDFSFLRLDKVGHIPKSYIKNNIFARLMVTHEAIELLRKNKDYTEVVSYTSAFSDSHLPTLITKLVASELGVNGNASQPKGSSPMAFLKWLLDLEDQGLNMTDGFISKHRARLVGYVSSLDLDSQSHKPNAGKTEDDLEFFIDNKGNDEDEKIDDSMNDAFVAAARTMQSDTYESGKKRKERHAEKKKDGVKFQRYNLADHSGSKSGKKAGLLEKDVSHSESEVEDPDSDEDLD